jgi:gamma-glutamyltranspeptidase/glutathione hydrolase
VLTPDDLAAFAATVEEPVSLDFRGWRVFKTGPWGQGPSSSSSSRCSTASTWAVPRPDHVHTVIEGAKLAFADREAWYGDSAPVPLELLLSREYADERRR